MTDPVPTLPPSRSATLGGVGAVLVTGVFAIVATGAVLVLARGYGFRMERIDWILLALVLALTIGGGVGLARFVRRHPGAIGEARFDTSNRDDRG